jgi:hypothetical protein
MVDKYLENNFLIIYHICVCIVSIYLSLKYCNDPFILIITLSIFYSHGPQLIYNSWHIPWNIIKIADFIGIIYTIYYGYWDICLIVIYSFISKFMSYKTQIPIMLIIFLLIIKLSRH